MVCAAVQVKEFAAQRRRPKTAIAAEIAYVGQAPRRAVRAKRVWSLSASRLRPLAQSGGKDYSGAGLGVGEGIVMVQRYSKARADIGKVCRTDF